MRRSPLISVVVPARNERDRIFSTLQSIAATRALTDYDLEVVIVDDASEDGCCSNLVFHTDRLSFPRLSVRVRRLDERVGVAKARNEAAAAARGEILFITDAHVRFSPGWDQHVLAHISETRILAATTTDPASAFKGFGCTLAVPFMGTHWIRRRPLRLSPVQVATCHGTVLARSLFHRIGGYDSGMKLYSAAEPEFSVRAWLSGAEILCLPELEVAHRFKPQTERDVFLKGLRPYMIHNSLRFGVLYLSDSAILQMVRYFSMTFPAHVQALRMLDESDVWERRAQLRRRLPRNFDWFVAHFNLKDQIGRSILSDRRPDA